MRKIVLIFLLVQAAAFADEFRPVFYATSPEAKRLFQVYQSLAARLGTVPDQGKTSAYLKNRLKTRAAEELLKQTVDMSKEVLLVAAVNKNIHRVLFEQGIDDVDFISLFRVSISYYLQSPADFIKLLETRYQKNSQGYQVEKNMTITVAENKATLFIGEEPIDTVLARKFIDEQVETKPVPENFTLRYKIDLAYIEKLWSKDVNQFAHLLKKDKPDIKTDKLKKPAFDSDWLVMYMIELYTKMNYQSYQFSPMMQSGYIVFTDKDNNLNFAFTTYSDLGNRPFLKLYNARRKYSLEEIKARGQRPTDPKNQMVYVSIPLPLKDFIETMNNYKGNDTFLIRDFMEFIFIVTDFIFLEDTRNKFWRNFNGNLDVYVFENKGDTKYTCLVDVEKSIHFSEYFDRAMVRFKSYKTKEKFKSEKLAENFYRLTNEGKEHYLLITDHLLAIGNDFDTMQHLQKTPALAGSLRVNNFSRATENSLPIFIRVDLEKIGKNIEEFKQDPDKLGRLKEVIFKIENISTTKSNGELNIKY